MKRTLLVSFLLAGLVGCAEHPCHDLQRPDLAAKASGTSSANTQAPAAATGANVNSQAALPAGHILVSKADGSKQCEANSGVAPEAMEKDLAGIQVYNRSKRSDGRMHSQVCGVPTGKMNVFEIDAASEAAAVKLGFKRIES